MEAISYEAFDALFTSFRREALHLEMRDAYGTAAEIPHLRRWEAGEPDDTDRLQPWFDLVRAGRQAGRPSGGHVSSLNQSPTTSGGC